MTESMTPEPSQRPDTDTLAGELASGSLDSVVRSGADAQSNGDIARDDQGRLVALTAEGENFIAQYRESIRQKSAEEQAQIQEESREPIEDAEADVEASVETQAEDQEIAENNPSREEEKVDKERDPIEVEKLAEETVRANPFSKEVQAYIAARQKVAMPAEPFRKADSIGSGVQRFFRRAYIRVFKNDFYVEQVAQKEKYELAQKELKVASRLEREWVQSEAKLIAEVIATQDLIAENYLDKIKSGNMEKKDWKVLYRATSHLEASRMRIDTFKLPNIAEQLGIDNYAPVERAGWQGIKTDEAFTKREEAEKTNLIEELKEARPEERKLKGALAEAMPDLPLASALVDLMPEDQQKFLLEQSGGVLRDLSIARVIKSMTVEQLTSLLDNPNVNQNPDVLFQVIDGLRSADLNCKVADKSVVLSMRNYAKAGAMRELGHQIVAGIKKGFGESVLGVDPDFEVKFDTEVKELLIKGDSAVAKSAKGAWGAFKMVQKVGNRITFFAIDKRKDFNELFAKFIPESKAESKVFELDGQLSELEQKKADINEVLHIIKDSEKEATDQKRKVADVLEAKALIAFNEAEEARVEQIIGEKVWEEMHSEQNQLKAEAIVISIIEALAPTDTRKNMLIERFQSEGLSESVVSEMVYLGQIMKLRIARQMKELNRQIKDLEAERAMTERRVDKATESAIDDNAEEQDGYYNDIELNIRLLGLTVQGKQDEVYADIADKIEQMGDILEQKMIKRLRGIVA